MRTYTEATLNSSVDTFFVGWTWIVRRTIYRFDETIIIFTEKVWWTSASIAIETDQITRTMIIDTAHNFLETQFVRATFMTRWTITFRLMIFS